MKRIFWLCLALCLFLTGCASATGENPDGTTATPTPSDSPDDDRLAYYEQMVTDLQKEILDLKAALYVSRTEYEELKATVGEVKPPESVERTDFRYTLKDGAVTVVEYLGTATTVEIPATFDGYPVRAIGDRAFAGQVKLTSVTIPEGIETIGWFAFSGCVMLESVTLPESITSIDYGAFEHCKSTLTVTCKDGSYACLWAESYGIRIQKV